MATNDPLDARSGRDDAKEQEAGPEAPSMVSVLWSYRRIVGLALAVVMALFFIIGATWFIVQPSDRVASLEFRAIFEGADAGMYPNGLAFSQSEITAAPVVYDVWEENDIQRYVDFDAFKNGFFVLQSSSELNLLALDYESKLANTRLSAVERARLEAEFTAKREAMRVPQYTLNFSAPRTGNRMPDVVLSKVLHDVLASWAEQAVNRRGVLKYSTPVFSPSVLLREAFDTEEFLIRVDVLRGTIVRVLDNLDELDALPGASVIRIGEDEQSSVSLSELRANLQDLLRHRLEPLGASIRLRGMFRDPSLVRSYVRSRMLDTQLRAREAQARVTSLRDSLASYMDASSMPASPTAQDPAGPAPGTVIPQLSESFLDRLVTLGRQDADIQYRQQLTDKIIEASQAAAQLERETQYYEEIALNPGGAGGADTAGVAKEFADIQSAVVLALQRIQEVYEEVSARNLNPRTGLYSIAGPFMIRSHRALSLGDLMLYALLTFVAALLVGCFAALVHYFVRGRESDQRARAAAADGPHPANQRT